MLEIFAKAKAFMRANNNSSQWADGYPDKEDILKDIKGGYSYVGEDETGELVMTFAFIEGEDPTYKEIEGQWLNDEYYGTIHRIASNGKVRGVLKQACDFCFRKVDNLRIDTHKANTPMLNALQNLGFQRCGIIICRDGTPREAFQKLLVR